MSGVKTDICLKGHSTYATSPIGAKSTSWDDMFQQLKEPVISLEDVVSSTLETQTSADMSSKSCFDVPKLVETKSSILCCEKTMVQHGSFLVCEVCGKELADTSGATNETYTTSNILDCNVNDKGFMAMHIVGRGSYGYNRSLLKTCAKYGQYRKMTTLKDMHNWNSQSSSGKHVPKNVIEEASNMFAKIKEHGYVYRKDVKKGVISACIYYACYNNGISKTPAEIAQLVGIAEKFHSAGDRILRDLNERGIIDLPEKIDPIIDYVERYMELLKIPKIYKQFVLDIIHVADREKLHVLSDSKNNTKCIGAIYLLIDRIPELRKAIDKETIDKECEISKTTFQKYYNLICKFYRKFVPVFVRHRIPMKREWKEDIDNIIVTRYKSDVPESVPAKKQIIVAANRVKKPHAFGSRDARIMRAIESAAKSDTVATVPSEALIKTSPIKMPTSDLASLDSPKKKMVKHKIKRPLRRLKLMVKA
jgi:hypothetical protein